MTPDPYDVAGYIYRQINEIRCQAREPECICITDGALELLWKQRDVAGPREYVSVPGLPFDIPAFNGIPMFLTNLDVPAIVYPKHLWERIEALHVTVCTECGRYVPDYANVVMKKESESILAAPCKLRDVAFSYQGRRRELP